MALDTNRLNPCITADRIGPMALDDEDEDDTNVGSVREKRWLSNHKNI